MQRLATTQVQAVASLARSVKLARLQKLGVRNYDDGSTVRLSPSRPVVKGCHLIFVEPKMVKTSASGPGFAIFPSHEQITLAGYGRLLFGQIKAWKNGRYVIEFVVSGAEKLHADVGDQNAVHMNPTNVLVVADGVAGANISFVLQDETSKNSSEWTFHECVASVVQ